jgi:4'-phosphopantetheinyl transferase
MTAGLKRAMESTDLADFRGLREGEVHLWVASTALGPEEAERARALLDEAERERADRFYFERDRLRFTAARAILRVLLARYLGGACAARDVRFGYGPRGKPQLGEPGQRASGVRFNLAHSHEVAVYGFTRNREIGVDVEHARPLPDLDSIACRFFCAGEREALEAIPAGEARMAAFYRCWTRKEAFVKLLGDGLSYPLDRFRVSLEERGGSLLEWVEGVDDVGARWEVGAFEVARGYAGAFAVEGAAGAMSIFRLDAGFLRSIGV